ncbi:hypothetical protein [Tumebacillus avium]|nr:hypothetical protein [Tumebacillus avium]
MKKWAISGLMFAAILSLLLGTSTVTNIAQTSPPDPAGIAFYK